MKKVLLTLLVTTLSLATVADEAEADKLCLKVAFNKKTSKVTTSSTVATTCPCQFPPFLNNYNSKVVVG